LFAGRKREREGGGRGEEAEVDEIGRIEGGRGEK